MKTSKEQGLTLFPDECFLTCPITTIAIALTLQRVSVAAFLNQLPALGPPTAVPLEPTSSLMNVLERGVVALDGAVEIQRGTRAAPGIHNYVNRLLDWIVTPASVSGALSLHSLRRDEAQHANDNADLSLQWIIDCGAWNMTATNTAFAYVFNTTSKDQKVSRMLSGWPSKSVVA